MFSEFVASRISEGHRAEFHGEKNRDSRVFGDDGFVAHALASAETAPAQKPDVNAVVAAVRKIYDIHDDFFDSQGRKRVLSEARGLAAWATLELSSGKLTELAPLLGRDPSTLTCAVRRMERRRISDPLIEEKMEQLRHELSSFQVLTL
jgi:chromosomal replication initiation ATPase DnaA